VTRACYQPVLQSSLEQWGMHFDNTSAAVHWLCITADLYGHQSS